MLPPILILAPYSSGSTAVTGYLARAGAYACPPFQMTNDPRTKNSHEPKALRDAICGIVQETTLQYTRSPENFAMFFRSWLPLEEEKAKALGHTCLVMKHPLSCFVLNQIIDVCQPRIVIVGRPLDEIEKTRERRGWHPVYGRAGAVKIYDKIFTHVLSQNLSSYLVGYRDFQNRAEIRQDLLKFCNLAPSTTELKQAEGWLRK